ncbi:Myosin-VIIa [Nymphon striatum]|nr:Myosin-VIIa [Nymphon striatum]
MGECITCDGRDDAAEFADIRSAMKVLMFGDKEIWEIMKILGALIHMGNIQYRPTIIDNLDATEIIDSVFVTKSANLIEVDKQHLVDALTTRSIFAHGDTVVSTMSAEMSLDVRDAFVKGIYGRMFIWIVNKINSAIYKPKAGSGRTSIGVLDIFGFENFIVNSFEQFCINYANENLQQFFVRHIFKLEQEEYNIEAINWHHIEFVDNQDSLDMIAVKPMNIMALVDEESKFPKGTDQTMLNKLHKTHGVNKNYLKPKSDINTSFGLNHFAGVVFYDSRGFLEKNRDTFSADLLQLIHVSKNKFLQNLFLQDIGMGTDTRKRAPSLSTQFKKSLDSLMRTLSQCQPFFIRCIKPNEQKKPMMFDRELCCKQLRYSGMMETIRIRRAGYPIRHTFKEFVDRYRFLISGIGPAHKIDCRSATSKLCGVVLGRTDFQLGRSKVFLKDAQDLYLEQERDRVLTRKILILQKAIRGWYWRRLYLRMKEASVLIQKVWRTYNQKKKYQAMRVGYMRLQAMIRSRVLSNRFKHLRGVIVAFQSQCRGYIVRRTYSRKLHAVVVIQAFVRGCIARRMFKKFKVEFHHRVEAMRLREKEEHMLRKQMNSKKAKELADQKYRERLQDIEMQEHETKMAERRKIERKKAAIQEAEYRRDEPVDDSKLVDAMFDFLPKTESTNDAPGPTAFKDLESFRDDAIANGEVEGSLPAPPEEDIDFNEYKFQKFAATYFQGNVTHTYSKKPLKHSLLSLQTQGDCMAALALWITILRFMGDLTDPKYHTMERDTTSVMSKVSATLGRNFIKSKEFQEAQSMGMDTDNYIKQKPRSIRNKLVSLTLKRKNKLAEDVRRKLQEDEYTTESYHSWLESRPTSNLEKLHFIIGHGILRSELRDEVYCQICKQLTNNVNKSSHARGWILLSLCVGCFAPSDRFVKYLRSFIRDGPPGYAPYCEDRLKRTFMLVVLFYFLMEILNSATTAKELCNQLADKINLKDQFGFSLYIALFDKVSSLGSGGDHVMDAISQCEQYAKEQGAQERNAPWRLFFRKEIFSPWHNPTEDGAATNLIYQQVVRGIKFGEYRCDKEDDLSMIAAQQYYIEFGTDVNIERLVNLLPNYIPDYCLTGGEKSIEHWSNLVVNSLKKSYYHKEQAGTIRVKEDIVDFAKFKWPLLFSRFYEAFRASGPDLPKNDIIIAVNWTGVFVVDDQEQVLLELSFPEITSITTHKADKPFNHSITISTVRGEEFTFQSTNSEDIKDLVMYFLDGLKKRSRYFIAIQDYKPPGDGSFLSFNQGDLIYLESESTGESAVETGWCVGRCEKTGEKGDFPAECIYVLPCITKPPDDILALFTNESAEHGKRLLINNTQVNGTDTGDRPHTLEEYAIDHFRPPPKRTLSKSLTLSSARRRDRDELWRHSRDPIKQPLLKKLQNKEELSQESCFAFSDILHFFITNKFCTSK